MLIGEKKMKFKAKKIAEIGEHVLFKNEIKGIVEKVNENTVLVNLSVKLSALLFIFNSINKEIKKP